MSGSTGDAPVLEGEHRLGEGMRRGVFCLGLGAGGDGVDAA